jgi:hypothetical protein
MAAMIKTPEHGLNNYTPDILVARYVALKGAE